eukprot:scaffold45455_cov34-Phaeocystis_antarctica.AAC.1
MAMAGAEAARQLEALTIELEALTIEVTTLTISTYHGYTYYGSSQGSLDSPHRYSPWQAAALHAQILTSRVDSRLWRDEVRLAELAAETAAAADAARQAEAAAALAAAAEQAERDARAMRLALAEAAEAAAAAAAEAARLAAEAAANKDPGDQAVLLELAEREAEVSGGG